MSNVHTEASELGYARHYHNEALDVQLFPPHDIDLNVASTSDQGVIDIIRLERSDYEDRLPAVLSSCVELVPGDSGKEKHLRASIDIGKEPDTIMAPIDWIMTTISRAKALPTFDVALSSPSSHVTRLGLLSGNNEVAIVTQDTLDKFIEISVPIENDAPQAYDSYKLMMQLFSTVHDAVALAYFKSPYRLTKSAPIPVVAGMTGSGTASDLQLALLLEIGKVNSTRPEYPLSFSSDIIGASLGFIESSINELDYEAIAKKLLTDKAHEHPQEAYALTHLDLLASMRNA